RGPTKHPDIQINLGIARQIKLADSGYRPGKRYRSRIRRRLRARVTARADEMMLVPVDPYAAIGQALVAPVKRDILTDSVPVLGYECFYSAKRSLLLDRKDKNQV